MEKVKKSYHLFFYTLVVICSYTLFNKKDKIEYKGFFLAIATFLVVCVSILLSIMSFIGTINREIITNASIYFSIMIPSVIVIYVCIYQTLLKKNKWLKYEEEFKSYPEKKKIKINVLVLLILIFVIGGMFCISTYFRSLREQGILPH